ncbi:MAG: arylsulfatase [Planctomycetaceae bacterium]
MVRRLPLPLLLCVAMVAGGRTAAADSQDQRTRERPNILILYADDLGYGDLSCQNSASKIPTPHLDRLASEGLRFTDGHSSSGICTPSRYALLTGRHHWRDFHGIVNAFGKSVFQQDQLTMPLMLKQRGYSTACIGKWHLGWNWDAIRIGENRKGNRPEDFDWSLPIPDGPLAHGFDHYFGDTVINFPPYVWIEDDRVTAVPDRILDTDLWPKIKEGNWECRPGPMVTGWNPYDVLPTLANKGVEYIQSRQGSDEPFFLYFAFPCPHAPIIPNDEFDGQSGAGPYGDFVVETDHVVGRLLDALAASGHAEDTLVVFSADNGPEHYAYARDENFGHWSAAPFRGLKRDIYEGGHHVPFLVRWPGVIQPGRVSDALVSQVDLLATCADILDFDLPDDAAHDSHNLLPILRGEVDSVREHLVHNTNAGGYAIRSGDWLLIDGKSGHISRVDAGWLARHEYPADNEQPVELYNLAEDIGQRRNLAAEHSEIVQQMQQRLRVIREQGHSAPRYGDVPAPVE